MGQIKTGITIKLLDQFSAPLKGMSAQLTKLNSQLGHINTSGVDKLKRSLKSITAPNLSKWSKDLGKFGNGAFRAAGNLNQAGEGATRFGVGIARGLKFGVDEVVKFDTGISRLSGIGNIFGADLDEMGQKAIRWGADTKYTAAEVLKTMENFAALGYDKDQTLKLTPATLSYATANDLSLDDASMDLGSTLKAFGKDADSAAEATDLLSSASAKSAATATYLQTVLERSGPLARTLGMDLRMVAAAGSVFAEAMPRDPAMAAEGLSSVLTHLSSLTKPAKESLTAMGLKVEEIQGLLNNGDMPEALKRMGDAMNAKGMSGTQKVDALKDIVGLHQASKFKILVDASVDPNSQVSFQRFYQEYADVKGRTAEMAKIMQNNLGGELERTGGALSELALKLGQILSPSIREALRTVQEFAGKLSAWSAQNPELAATLVRVAAATSVAAIAMGGLLFTMSFATSTFGGAAKGLSWLLKAVAYMPTIWAGLSAGLSGIGSAIAAIGAALATPAAAIAALVALAAVGGYYMYKWLDSTGKVSAWFKESFSAIGDAVIACTEFVVGAFTLAGRLVIAIFKGTFTAVGALAKWAGGLVVDAWHAVGEFFGSMWDGLKTVAGGAFGLIGDIATSIAETVKSAWGGVADFFSGIWESVASTFRSVMGPVLDELTGAIDAIRELGRATMGTNGPPPLPTVEKPNVSLKPPPLPEMPKVALPSAGVLAAVTNPAAGAKKSGAGNRARDEDAPFVRDVDGIMRQHIAPSESGKPKRKKTPLQLVPPLAMPLMDLPEFQGLNLGTPTGLSAPALGSSKDQLSLLPDFRNYHTPTLLDKPLLEKPNFGALRLVPPMPGAGAPAFGMPSVPAPAQGAPLFSQPSGAAKPAEQAKSDLAKVEEALLRIEKAIGGRLTELEQKQLDQLRDMVREMRDEKAETERRHKQLMAQRPRRIANPGRSTDGVG